MPDDDLLRSTLREQWHLVPAEITALPGGLLSHGWEVTAGGERFVARLADPAARQPVEAGLAAAEHLRGTGIEAGEPVRTLSGGLTAETPAGALAVLRRAPGRTLDGRDPIDQQFWGDRLGAVHKRLQGFHHPGLRRWKLLDPEAAHLAIQPWLRPAVTEAVTAMTRLTVTDRLTYGVLHGDPAPEIFLVDPATGRAGLLDCGASGTGPLLYDVAAAVVYAGGPDTATELLDGYLAAGPVAEDELHAALPVLLRFRWAVQADWSARRLVHGEQRGDVHGVQPGGVQGDRQGGVHGAQRGGVQGDRQGGVHGAQRGSRAGSAALGETVGAREALERARQALAETTGAA